MTREEVSLLINGLKDKIKEIQTDNPVFESLNRTQDKINNLKTKEDEKNTTK